MKHYELNSADLAVLVQEWLDEMNEELTSVHYEGIGNIVDWLRSDFARAGLDTEHIDVYTYAVNAINIWRWNNQPE
jgi:hypothetical protein